MLRRGHGERGDLVAVLVKDKAETRWITLWIGQIDPEDRVASVTPPQATAQGQAQDVAGHPPQQ